MAINALLAARTKLKADAALTAFFVDRYGRDAKHFVGYKRPINANDLPTLCYVPIRARDPEQVGGMTKEHVSIVIAICEKNFTGEIADGITYGQQAELLVKNCIESGELGAGAMYLGPSTTTTDLAQSHPFYEIEISTLLGAR